MGLFNLFHKKHLHSRLLVLVALPEDRAGFDAICDRGDSDFIHSMMITYNIKSPIKLWDQYASTAESLRKTLKVLEKDGAIVVRNFQLSNLVMLRDFDTVVILAHHSDSTDEIELSQGMVHTSQFISAIPLDVSAIIDLTSCYSTYLIPRLKSHIPTSRIIGIDVATTLIYRLFLLEKVVDYMCDSPEQTYLDALKQILDRLSRLSDSGVCASDLQVHLGGSSLQSTIYAPSKAAKGDTFLVSVFIHKPSNKDEVEIMAKCIDEDTQLRNTKKISLKIKTGDKIEFLLDNSSSEDFILDKKKKSITWDGDTNSVEFSVSVSHTCRSSSFIGKIRAFVNKEPAVEMMFKTSIVDNTPKNTIPAEFSFTAYDKVAETQEANTLLLGQLKRKEQEIRKALSGGQEETCLKKELDICLKCIELLTQSNRTNANNKILKVFISSTSDMKPYRKVMEKRVLELEMYPDMYEKWGQGNEYPRDVCCKHVLDSDIFVLILGAKYGFVEPIWDKSMTEIEYRIALNAGIPMLVYVDKDYQLEIQDTKVQDQSLAIRQQQLITEICNRRLVSMFSGETSLTLQADPELLIIKNKLLS